MTYAGFDMIWDHIARVSQPRTTSHAPCGMLDLVAMRMEPATPITTLIGPCNPIYGQFTFSGRDAGLDQPGGTSSFGRYILYFGRFGLDVRGHT